MALRILKDSDLIRHVQDGQTPIEIAAKYGVSNSAVARRIKRLRLGITKDVALRSAAKIVDRGMDAIAQLTKINSVINAELDRIEEDATRAPEKARQGLQDARLKHVAEIRKQIGLMTEIYQLYANYEESKAFKQALFQALKECAPQAIPAFRQKLRDLHAVRSDLDLDME